MLFVSLSEFRETLALANANRRDHQRKSGEKPSNISNTLYSKHNESLCCLWAFNLSLKHHLGCIGVLWSEKVIERHNHDALSSHPEVEITSNTWNSFFWWFFCATAASSCPNLLKLKSCTQRERKLPVLLNSALSSLSDVIGRSYTTLLCVRGQCPSARLYK